MSLGAVDSLKCGVGLLVVLLESLDDLLSDFLERRFVGGCDSAWGRAGAARDRWAGCGNHFDVCVVGFGGGGLRNDVQAKPIVQGFEVICLLTLSVEECLKCVCFDDDFFSFLAEDSLLFILHCDGEHVLYDFEIAENFHTTMSNNASMVS